MTDYPSKADLRFIRTYDFSKKPLKPFIEWLEDEWWAPEWGFTLKKKTDEFTGGKVMVLYLSTGGWSGNEDRIRALEKNKWFYLFYWESSRRGGHYEFRFSEDSWKKVVRE